MTVTYRATGRLTEPVNDLGAAMLFLQERQRESPMAQFIYPDEATTGVESVTWYLTGPDAWEVDVVLAPGWDATDEQLKQLSEWISGQNSDGLGEGFEQQSFAEHENPDFDEDETELMDASDFIMSSFDWETNPCTLTRVTP